MATGGRGSQQEFVPGTVSTSEVELWDEGLPPVVRLPRMWIYDRIQITIKGVGDSDGQETAIGEEEATKQAVQVVLHDRCRWPNKRLLNTNFLPFKTPYPSPYEIHQVTCERPIGKATRFVRPSALLTNYRPG